MSGGLGSEDHEVLNFCGQGPNCSVAVQTMELMYGYYTAILWQKEASDKRTFLVKEQNVSSFALTSMEYYDVLPNISLSRMSVYA